MTTLTEIIKRLNQRIAASNIFDKIYGLSEVNPNKKESGYVHYIGNGQAEVVTNYDAVRGTIFWVKRGSVSTSPEENLRVSGCKKMYRTTFPLTAYCVVRKSHLPCDSSESEDWIGGEVNRYLAGIDFGFKQSLGVMAYEVLPSSYSTDVKTLPPNPEWACLTVDFNVYIVTDTAEGCYNLCTGDPIPLPPAFEACQPCLTQVAVDGVTITGNGTVADPLVAIGGGGGTPLITKEEGTTVSANTTTLNFTGAGATATLTSAGVVEVNIPGGGSGGVGTLQEVTDLGNTTTNDIDFIANAGLSFDNGAFIRKGTTDAGNGGAKGTAQICSISYELKWEAGRLYYMEQDGFTIRDVTHNFTFVPQPTDDSTKGFVNGSRWSLDDGTVYECSDATIGAAVWAVVSVGGVTSVTATSPLSSSGGATPDISIQPASSVDDGYLTSADWNTFDGKFDVPTGTNSDYLDGTGTPTPFPTLPTGTVTSVDLSMPAAFSVSGNPVTTSGTLAVTAAGVASQYIRGDGQLANFPTSSGGGASVSYYLNGSVAQGTLGGVAFKQMSNTPVIGAGTDFSINADGYIQSFITDASVPNQLLIPAGNWNFEMYFSANNGGSSPRFYIDIFKLSAGTLSLIASSSANPEYITNGAVIDLYTTAVAMPSTVLLAADRIAIRVYVIHSSKTITLHTEDNHLCQVITTFSTGITALNGLTDQTQLLAVGTSGTDFAISSVSPTHTFNLPTASATNRGALSSADWSAFDGKQNALGFTPVTNARTITINGTAQDLSADRSWTIPALTVFKDTTTGTASSTNTNTVSKTQLIPAGTFGNDIIQLDWGTVNKTGTGGTVVYRVYVNGTADLTGSPQLIATYLAANVQSGTRMERRLNIKSATVTELPTATTVLLTDIGVNVLTNYNINWAVDKYFVFCVQNTGGTDSTAISYYRIIKT